MYHGIINVYKDAGYTSFDVIAKLRNILGQKKIGHTGTLDPEATGVLPVCLGVGTKACDFLMEHTKTYRAVLLLGKTTDTEDIFGEVLEERAVDITEEDVVETINSFIGPYDQMPPMYSAIKINGQKLCDLARSGRVVERTPRKVDILDIKIEKIELPRVYMEVTCGKGTYIRSLCRDIGEKLSCGACMEALERTVVGIYTKENSFTLKEIETMHKIGNLRNNLGKVEDLFYEYPKVVIKQIGDKYLYNGNPINFSNVNKGLSESYESSEIIRLYLSDETFAGLYKPDFENQKFYPDKMFLETLEPVNRAIAIGKFDGCHLGHAKLFKKLQEIHQETGLESMLLVIAREGERILNDEERFMLASEYGIKKIEKLELDDKLMNMKPESFVSEIIVRCFHGKSLVVGDDFRFGVARSGDVSVLDELGNKYGFETHILEKELSNGREISSSWIKEELNAGNLDKAKELLGFDFCYSGYVIYGNRIGRTIDFPTVNIRCEGKVKVPFGVYGVKVYANGEEYFGIANFGVKPTVSNSGEVLLEAHLFDCDKDLYGAYIKAELLKFIRPEKKFDSLEELKEQIKKDKMIFLLYIASLL